MDIITAREEECVICGETINIDYDPWEQIPEYYGDHAYICELCTKEAYARAKRI